MMRKMGGMEKLGDVIRQRRKKLRYSQEEVAASAGISQSYLSDIERRDTLTPDREKLKRIAEVLELPYAHVLQLAGLALQEDLAVADTAGRTWVVKARLGDASSEFVLTPEIAKVLAAIGLLEEA